MQTNEQQAAAKDKPREPIDETLVMMCLASIQGKSFRGELPVDASSLVVGITDPEEAQSEEGPTPCA